MKAKLWMVLTLLVVVAMLSACGATPEPATIIQTVEVEKQVTVVATVEVEREVTVVETVEVEKEVPVEVTPVPEAKPFEGVVVDVLTFTGPQIAEPLQRRAPDFEGLTGA